MLTERRKKQSLLPAFSSLRGEARERLTNYGQPARKEKENAAQQEKNDEQARKGRSGRQPQHRQTTQKKQTK